MIVRALPRLGLAFVLAATASTSGCASDLDEGVTRSPESATPREQPSRAQIYDRDRALVAGLATSLALGIVGLGTLLASGIYATPGSSDPHPVPKPILITGGIMSLGFFTAVPFAIGVERHRARHPAFFPGQRGRTRDLQPQATAKLALPASPGVLPASPGALPASPGVLPASPGVRPASPGVLPSPAPARADLTGPVPNSL